jgi:hypothetical protein
MAQFARHAAALRRLDVPAAVVWGVEDPVLRAEVIVPRFVGDLRIAPDDVHLLARASLPAGGPARRWCGKSPRW